MNGRFMSVMLSLFLLSQPLRYIQAAQPSSSSEILEVSLEEVIAVAILNSLDIQLAELDRSIHETRILHSKGDYDPELSLDLEYQKDESEGASSVAANEQTDHLVELELSQKLITGTTLATHLTHQRTETDSSFATINPSYSSGLEFEVTQSLVRNIAGVVDRAKLKLTELEVTQLDLESIDQIEEVINQVGKAYWALVAAMEKVRIYEEGVEWSYELEGSIQKNFQLGLIEKPEMLLIQANVYRWEEKLLIAQNEVDTVIETLKLLLNEKREVIVQATDSLEIQEYLVDFDQSYELAINKRRDYQQAILEVQAREINVKMKANEKLPEVDLTASFKANGLDRKYQESLREVINGENPTYFLGFEVSWILGDRAAKGDLEKERLEKAKALIALDRMQQLITKEVSEGVREVLLKDAQAQKKTQIRELYYERFIEEKRRFHQGRSGIKGLVDAQRDYLEAENDSIAAVVAHHQAWFELKRKENRLLEAFGYES